MRDSLRFHNAVAHEGVAAELDVLTNLCLSATQPDQGQKHPMDLRCPNVEEDAHIILQRGCCPMQNEKMYYTRILPMRSICSTV
jgi:hypothetical protein